MHARERLGYPSTRRPKGVRQVCRARRPGARQAPDAAGAAWQGTPCSLPEGGRAGAGVRARGARGAPRLPGRSPDGSALRARAQAAPAAGDAGAGAPALALACLAVLDGWGRLGAAPPAELGRELLLGGWLAQHYLMCALPHARSAVPTVRARRDRAPGVLDCGRQGCSAGPRSMPGGAVRAALRWVPALGPRRVAGHLPPHAASSLCLQQAPGPARASVAGQASAARLPRQLPASAAPLRGRCRDPRADRQAWLRRRRVTDAAHAPRPGRAPSRKRCPGSCSSSWRRRTTRRSAARRWPRSPCCSATATTPRWVRPAARRRGERAPAPAGRARRVARVRGQPAAALAVAGVDADDVQHMHAW